MKHIKDLNEWQDHLQMQADQAGMTKEEWIAAYGSNIQGVDYIESESQEVGGQFRAPGYKAQAIKLMKETFKRRKFKI